MTHFHCHWRDGKHVVCSTTTGLDHSPVPTGVFGTPRDAIRYAQMRQRQTSPLRSPDEEPASAPRPASQSVPSPAPLASLGE